MSLNKARQKAYDLGLIKEDHDLKDSGRVGKRFMIKHKDKWIHFGAWPFAHGTYLDHHDDKIRKAWFARHKKKLKDGAPAYLNPKSPLFYSAKILW
jgi:hypothetical protein